MDDLRKEHAASEADLRAQIGQLEDEVFHMREQVVVNMDAETAQRVRVSEALHNDLARVERTLGRMIDDESTACSTELQELHATVSRIAAGLSETIRVESVHQDTRERQLRQEMLGMQHQLAARIDEESSGRQAGDSCLQEAVANAERDFAERLTAEAAALRGERRELYARLSQMESAWDARLTEESHARLGEDVCLLDLIGDDRGELLDQLRLLEGRMDVLSAELTSPAVPVSPPAVHVARKVAEPALAVPSSDDEYGPPDPVAAPDTVEDDPVTEPSP